MTPSMTCEIAVNVRREYMLRIKNVLNEGNKDRKFKVRLVHSIRKTRQGITKRCKVEMDGKCRWI